MSLNVPNDPRERQGWVLYQLKLRGESFASVAARIGMSRGAIRHCLTQPSFNAEKALAAALGLTVRQLFPERYDAKGRRLHVVRAREAA